MTIIWDASKMSTGMPSVDAEHQEWIRRFNDFENAVLTGQGADALQTVLNFMIEYSESHFVHEEMLAGDVDTPAVKLNRTEHNKFRANIQEMKDWVRVNGPSSVEVLTLKMNLEEWLVHHICNVDAQLWVRPK